MKELIDNLKLGVKILIKNKEYIVNTKTWYSIEEDNTASYIKCELSNNRVLVIIPDDNLIYLGEVIDNMNYEKVSENEITYNKETFKKTGDGHQYITKIEFGNKNEVEGKCIFQDFESNDKIISLGLLPDKENARADVYADIIGVEDIIVIN